MADETTKFVGDSKTFRNGVNLITDPELPKDKTPVLQPPKPPEALLKPSYKTARDARK